MLELHHAFAMQIGMQRHTKAQVQPAKEGVLDAECKDAARRELRRRRFKRIRVPGARSGRQFHNSLLLHHGQFLRMLGRVR